MANENWATAGNTGNTPDNYLGTTDQQPIVFKAAGNEIMRLTPESSREFPVNGLPRFIFVPPTVNIGTITANAGLDVTGNVLINRTGENWGSTNAPTTEGESLVVKHIENGISPAVTYMNDGGGYFLQRYLFGADAALPNGEAASVCAHWQGLITLAQQSQRFMIGPRDSSTLDNDANPQMEMEITSGNVHINHVLTVDGDIILTNADVAEDFTVAEPDTVLPGSVMIFKEDGSLEACDKEYDKKAAGVVSGGGSYKPGLILDRKEATNTRKPIALMGKVFCMVDADKGAIEVGDMLTTSATKGHAMKALDPFKAFGAVIGKALKPLAAGKGLLPILVALQ